MPIDSSVFSVPPCETKAIPIEKRCSSFILSCMQYVRFGSPFLYLGVAVGNKLGGERP